MPDLFNKKKLDSNSIEENSSVDANALNDSSEKKEKKAKKNKMLYLEHNTMNFLERYEAVVEGKSSADALTAYKKPLIILAVVIVILALVAQGLNIYSSLRVNSLDKYIKDPANVEAYDNAIQVKAKVDQATLQKNNMEAMITAIATYPDIDQNFFNAVNTAATANSIVISNYGYAGETGYFTVSCTSSTPQNITAFIRALDATGLFANIEYSGFSGGAEGGYGFSVSCYCNAGE